MVPSVRNPKFETIALTNHVAYSTGVYILQNTMVVGKKWLLGGKMKNGDLEKKNENGEREKSNSYIIKAG